MSSRSTHSYRQQEGNNKNNHRGGGGGGGFNRTTQKRYVQKPQNSSKQEEPPISISNSPSFTTSLRETTGASSSSSSKSTPISRVRIGENGDWVSSRNQEGGKFVNYLPQDEAVAIGLGVEDGALDPVESQRVVDLLNRELSRLLTLKPKDFWKEVASDTTLHDFLDSFLQFRRRWYDFPHRGAKGLVAGVIVGELELSRRVFMVLFRIASNRDPGARTSDSLSAKEHGALLQEKKLLDLPKLLDICAIYGHENEGLTRSLVTNAMQSQPVLHENLSAVVSRFLSVVQTMHQRCDMMLETLGSSGGHDDFNDGRVHADFLEVLDFINDAVASLDAFVNAYRPAALYFSCYVEMSYGSGELLGTLARLHDSLLPCLQRGVGKNKSGGVTPTSFKILSMRIINFFWKLLEICYLSTEVVVLEGVTASKMFPSTVEDPMIRGDILVQTLREINEEVSRHGKGGVFYTGTLLQKVQNTYQILSRLDELRGIGWILMDEEQLQYVTLLLMPPPQETTQKLLLVPTSTTTQMDENAAAITESKISQIKDLFPDYGKGFLAACLEAYNQNPEEVIQRILEGTLHEQLQSMDTSLDKIPPPLLPKSTTTTTTNNKDKGKGLASDVVVERQTEVSGSSSSHVVGRYTRKTTNVDTLDSTRDKDSAKTALLAAAQYEEEYNDEYDDSFDDLGLSVVESGYEEPDNHNVERERENPNNRIGGGRGKKTNTPQFYVKDGKNYSYKVAGAVGVMDTKEAALVNQAQKQVINGLGRGGNLPLGAVKALEEEEESTNEHQDHDTGGRGGRGRRRGGRSNNFRKDRAMKKHFAGLGGGF